MRLAKVLRILCGLLLLSIVGPGSFAAVTSLRLESETGDNADGEKLNFYSSEDGHLKLLPPSPDGADASEEVKLEFVRPLRPGWPISFSWRLWFTAPPGETLAVGLYDDAVVPFRREAGQPGLQIYEAYDGAIAIGGCFGTTTGHFEVKQIAFDPDGMLTRFWATFEQTCGQAVRGEIRFNADVPVELHAPTHRTAREGHALSFDVQGVDALGNPVALGVTGLPPGASFTESAEGTGHFAWTPAPGQAGFVGWVAFTGESSGGDTDIVYTRIDAIPDFDDFDHPIPFTTLPFESAVYQSPASAAADDPQCPGPAGGVPGPPGAADQGSNWYAFTPVEDSGVQVAVQLAFPIDPLGFPLPPPGFAGVAVYTGERGALDPIVCGSFAQRFTAHSGLTYHIMVDSPPASEIRLSAVALPPPPANDDVASATVVGTLPFSDSIDTRGAMFQPAEPRHCIPPPPGTSGPGSTVPPTNVWYAYTPSKDTRLTVDTTGSNYPAPITAFRGQTGALLALGCDSARLSFTALAGETYHLMIGGSVSSYGDQIQVSFTGKPALRIQVAIDAAGAFDPHSGAALIGGTAHCSRPAEIVVEGTLRQDHRRVQGDFETVVACDGETPWQAIVMPLATGNHQKRFAGGSAEASIHARGVPEDDPEDLAFNDGSSQLILKADPSH